MAKKLSQMTPAGTLADTDLLLVSVDAATAPKSRKATLAQVRGTPKVTLVDEGTSLGLFHTLKFVGSAITVTEESPGVAVVTVAEAIGGAGSHVCDATVVGKPGTNGVSTTLLRFVAPLSMSIPSGWAGSRAYAEVAATASTTFYINKNGVNIGTIVFGVGQQTGVFASDPAATPFTLVAGDRITLYTGAVQDATLADMGFSLLLYK